MMGRLRKFGEKFKCPICMVLGPEIKAYTTALKVGGRSKYNVRKHLKNLFHFAQSRGYLPKGLPEADDLARVKENPKPIGISRPDEMASRMLERCRKRRRIRRGRSCLPGWRSARRWRPTEGANGAASPRREHGGGCSLAGS
jgi:hypothetical protein